MLGDRARRQHLLDAAVEETNSRIRAVLGDVAPVSSTGGSLKISIALIPGDGMSSVHLSATVVRAWVDFGGDVLLNAWPGEVWLAARYPPDPPSAG